MVESQWTQLRHNHHVDRLEYNLLHGWEVKFFHYHLGAILDVDGQINLFFVVVLEA